MRKVICLGVGKVMNWNHLYCFYEVARKLSIKNAALEMGLAPSTVSEQIKRFETENATTFFVRKGREIYLNEEGERVFNYARGMFERGKRLEESLSFDAEAGYSVSFGVESKVDSPILDQLIARYYGLYSSFGLVETRRVKNFSQSLYFLENRLVDLVFTTEQVSKEKFNFEKVFDLEYVFYVSRDLFELFRQSNERNTAKELIRSMPMAFFGAVNEGSSFFKNYLFENQVSPKEVFKGEHLGYLKELVKASKITLLAPDDRIIDPTFEKISFKKALSVPIYGMWNKDDENLLFIRKFKELMLSLRSNTISSKFDYSAKI